MNSDLAEQIKDNLSKKTTEELLSIWAENDRTEWSEEAFAAIHVLLTDRGAAIPSQKNIDANGAKGVAPEKKGSIFAVIIYFALVAMILIMLIIGWDKAGSELLALKVLPNVPLFSSRVFGILLIVIFTYYGIREIKKL